SKRMVSCCRLRESRTVSMLIPCCASAWRNCAMSIRFSRASCSTRCWSSSSLPWMPSAVASRATRCSSMSWLRARLRISLRCASPAGPAPARASSGATRSSSSESVIGWPFTTAAMRSLISATAANDSTVSTRRRRMTPPNITDLPLRSTEGGGKKDLLDQGKGGVVDLDLGRRTELLKQLPFRLGALFGRCPALDLRLDVLELPRPRPPPAEHLEHVVPVGRGHDAGDLVVRERETGVV